MCIRCFDFCGEDIVVVQLNIKSGRLGFLVGILLDFKIVIVLYIYSQDSVVVVGLFIGVGKYQFGFGFFCENRYICIKVFFVLFLGFVCVFYVYFYLLNVINDIVYVYF